MSRKFAVINVLLIVIVVFLAMEVYQGWMNPKPRGTGGSASKPRATASAATASLGGKKETPSPATFKPISDKNVFSPDRKEFPVTLTGDAKKPTVRPNVVLFGIVVGDQFHSAVVNNPTRKADKGERETMTVQEGDKIGDYKVAKISPDRISLETEEDSFDVLLYDPSKPKKRPAVAGPSPAAPTPPPPTQPGMAPSPRPFTPPPAVTQPPGTPPSRPATPVPPTRRNLMRERIEQRRTPAPPPRTPPMPSAEDEEEDEDS